MHQDFIINCKLPSVSSRPLPFLIQPYGFRKISLACRARHTAICQPSKWAIQVLCSGNVKFHFLQLFHLLWGEKKTKTVFFKIFLWLIWDRSIFSVKVLTFFTKFCCYLVIFFPGLNHSALLYRPLCTK